MNRKRNNRLDRIERKLDLILSQLLTLRRRIAVADTTDRLIDRLHTAARKMKKQCERERDNVRGMVKGRGR